MTREEILKLIEQGGEYKFPKPIYVGEAVWEYGEDGICKDCYVSSIEVVDTYTIDGTEYVSFYVCNDEPEIVMSYDTEMTKEEFIEMMEDFENKFDPTLYFDPDYQEEDYYD